ncbi:hypothetical protein M422DRAFT_68327 [Sphaerobolus stellatus SS14]|uniref:Mid2 domain-containing protein n=1 Tax=Sphaerobolus stellatus (strain SS14) TaxID=990650 RepID=A0A0C9VT89_SPHS4|nr:hypothetical protein M422DRAFT_68327 [Sphaerobolus stellatus SS14]
MFFFSLFSVHLCLALFSATVLAAERNATIDDRDPRLVYSHGWAGPISKADAFNNTLTVTRVKGATLSFNFTGVQLYIFGDEDNASKDGTNVTTVVTYSIDQGFSTVKTIDPSLRGIDNFLLFSSSRLDDKPHNLLLTNVNGGSWYWLDRIVVTVTDEDGSNPSISPSPSPLPSPSPSPSPLPLPSPSNSSKSLLVAPGTVVGASIGGLILVLMILGGTFLLYRRRIRKDENGHDPESRINLTGNDSIPPSRPNSHGIEPFYVKRPSDNVGSMQQISTPQVGIDRSDRKQLSSTRNTTVVTAAGSISSARESTLSDAGSSDLPPSYSLQVLQ